MKVSLIFIGTLFSVLMVAYANYYQPMMKGGYGYATYFPVHQGGSSGIGGGGGFGSGGIFEIIIFLFIFILIIQVLFGGLYGGGYGRGGGGGYYKGGSKGGYSDY